jgi:hypothetical protein
MRHYVRAVDQMLQAGANSNHAGQMKAGGIGNCSKTHSVSTDRWAADARLLMSIVLLAIVTVDPKTGSIPKFCARFVSF